MILKMQTKMKYQFLHEKKRSNTKNATPSFELLIILGNVFNSIQQCKAIYPLLLKYPVKTF